MPEISPKAAVADPSGLSEDVRVGAFSVIGPDVTVGAGTVVHNHVTITGRTKIGSGCELFPCSVVGVAPDGRHAGGTCSIADNNVLREHVIVEAGTGRGAAGTVLGPNNLLMVGCQIGHDACLEGEGIFANLTRVEPHARIEKFVRTAGFTVIKPYVTVGAYAFATGYASVERDVPPYAIVQGLPSLVRSVNAENLRRCGFDAETISILREAFRTLFDGQAEFPDPQRLRAAADASDNEHVRFLIDSLRRSAASPTGRRLQPAGSKG
jgi:UDP-N-acetylglucosamine acyltransferase